jgi:hypothetical protein
VAISVISLIVIFAVVFIGVSRLIRKKKRTTPTYTPFDFITGQTETEFRQKETSVQEDDERDKENL